jgi:hypothetical protein
MLERVNAVPIVQNVCSIFIKESNMFQHQSKQIRLNLMEMVKKYLVTR